MALWKAYLTRIKIEGEGGSAADLEGRFLEARDLISRALNSACSIVQMVTEMGYDSDGIANSHGRCVLSVQLDGLLTSEDVALDVQASER